jgi:exosome complex component RRP45
MNVERRVVAKAERTFIRNALFDGLRLDGRRDVDTRPLRFAFLGNGVAEVQLGRTRVACVITCEIEEPFVDRAHDGSYAFDVVMSPMASAAFPRDGITPGKERGCILLSFSPPQDSVFICRVVERTLRESGAIDTESLCIVAGSKVWAVSVVLHVLDYAGNVTDACSYAALAALLHFRRPAVSVSGSTVTVHAWREKDPTPLAVHHTPVCVSFGFVQHGEREVVIVDPSDQEELVVDGTCCIALNAHTEVCSVQCGGCAVAPDALLRCMALAAVRSREMIDAIQTAVAAALKEGGNIGNRNLIAYLEAKQ